MANHKPEQPGFTQETRKAKMLMGSPGGNAGKGASYYRVGIPPVWAQTMGVSSEDRDLLLTFDGKRVIIEKAKPEDKYENPSSSRL